MNFGDVVLYVENGTAYPAQVLAVRTIDSLAGALNKPVVDVGFFSPANSNLLGTGRQLEMVQFRHDVPHCSVNVSGPKYVELSSPVQISQGYELPAPVIPEPPIVPGPVSGGSDPGQTVQ